MPARRPLQCSGTAALMEIRQTRRVADLVAINYTLGKDCNRPVQVLTLSDSREHVGEPGN